MSLFSTTIILFLVIEPLGLIPVFQALMTGVSEKRVHLIAIRESLVAYVILLVFLFYGERVLSLLQISQTSLGIAGGFICFLIALKMLFPDESHEIRPESNPFIVPIALPLIAGPSSITTVMLLVSKDHITTWQVWVSLTIVIALTASILCLSGIITKLTGRGVTLAIERLMGFILTVIAVEMLLSGIKDFILSFK